MGAVALALGAGMATRPAAGEPTPSPSERIRDIGDRNSATRNLRAYGAIVEGLASLVDRMEGDDALVARVPLREAQRGLAVYSNAVEALGGGEPLANHAMEMLEAVQSFEAGAFTVAEIANIPRFLKHGEVTLLEGLCARVIALSARERVNLKSRPTNEADEQDDDSGRNALNQKRYRERKRRRIAKRLGSISTMMTRKCCASLGF